MSLRPDSALADLDIPVAIVVGMAGGQDARRVMFSDAAIAASLRLQDQGVGPYPVRFLAGYVRSAGRAAALALPEPLVGDVPRELVRLWLAAGSADSSVAQDEVFARWLEMVAALIELRRAKA